MKSSKFKLITHGCRTNQYETQAYRDQLLALGLTEVEGDEEADICIVNSCTVTHAADQTSLRSVSKLKRENPNAKLVVTGCMAEAKQEELRKNGVELVVLNKEKEELINKLFPDLSAYPEFAIKNFEAHTRAFIKVQDGCNSYCTYCIIPYVRGRSRAKPLEQVLDEARDLVRNGYREVVITGINVGDYVDGENKLADLIRAVDGVEGLARLRLSSIDPDEVDDDLMTAMLEGKHTCSSMHIVLQSGSNVILKRMNRKYTRQIFLESISRLKAANPSFTFTTDLIVGFPGETEQDFEQSLEVIEQAEFAKVHIFPYSPRARTRAATYPDQISDKIMKERKKRAEEVATKAAFRLRERYVGKELVILTENTDRNEIQGHSDNFLLVRLPGQKGRANELIRVRCIGNDSEGLIGEKL